MVVRALAAVERSRVALILVDATVGFTEQDSKVAGYAPVSYTHLFKDDDERLSFLFGNYITMTNMQDHEIERIIKMHLSLIHI